MPGEPHPSGLTYAGGNVGRLRQRVDAQRRENGRRLLCPHCDLTVAPEGFARHLLLVHDIETSPGRDSPPMPASPPPPDAPAPARADVSDNSRPVGTSPEGDGARGREPENAHA